MMKDYQLRKLSEQEIENLWYEFYKANSAIYDALKSARESDIETKSLERIDKLIEEGSISNLKFVLGLDTTVEDEVRKNRLYKYWNEAGLEGTPQDAFTRFIFTRAYEYLDLYDFSKPVMTFRGENGETIEGNSRVARNNLIIDLMMAKLEDEDTFKDRLKPASFDKHINAARMFREIKFAANEDVMTGDRLNLTKVEKRSKIKELDPEPNYDPSNPLTILLYNQKNQVAGKLIGIAANQNANHAYSTLLYKMELEEPIEFCGHSFSDLLHNPEGKDGGENIHEFLESSVDAVKNPVLEDLNYNMITADAVSLLLRLGYEPFEVGLLMNQPIVRMLCEECFNGGRRAQQGIKRLREKLESKSTSISMNGNLDTPLLANYARKFKCSYTPLEEWSSIDIAVQSKVLDLFEQVANAGSQLSQFIMATKFTAANAIGSTFGDYYAKFYTMEGLKFNKLKIESREGVSDVMHSGKDVLEMSDLEYFVKTVVMSGNTMGGNPFAFEQVMYDMYRKANKLSSKYFPYEGPLYSGIRNYMNGITNYGHLDADEINAIHSEYLMYLLASQDGSSFDASKQDMYPSKIGYEWVTDSVRGDYSRLVVKEKKKMSKYTYYTYVFPQILAQVLRDRRKDLGGYALFDKMFSITTDSATDNTFVPDIQIRDVGGLNEVQKEEIKNSWADLMDNNPVSDILPNFAEDLFFYNYYKLGFQFSPLSFIHLVPTELKLRLNLKEDMSYVEFLRRILWGFYDTKKNTGNIKRDFVVQFIQNHSDNSKFVYSPYTNNDTQILMEKAYSHEGRVRRSRAFTVNINNSSTGENDLGCIVERGEKISKFAPAIMLDGNLFIANNMKGYTGNEAELNGNLPFNMSSTGEITYEPINFMGDGVHSLFYFSNSQSINPILNDNIGKVMDDDIVKTELPKDLYSYYKTLLKTYYDEVLNSIKTELRTSSEDSQITKLKEEAQDINSKIANLENLEVGELQALADREIPKDWRYTYTTNLIGQLEELVTNNNDSGSYKESGSINTESGAFTPTSDPSTVNQGAINALQSKLNSLTEAFVSAVTDEERRDLQKQIDSTKIALETYKELPRNSRRKRNNFFIDKARKDKSELRDDIGNKICPFKIKD